MQRGRPPWCLLITISASLTGAPVPVMDACDGARRRRGPWLTSCAASSSPAEAMFWCWGRAALPLSVDWGGGGRAPPALRPTTCEELQTSEMAWAPPGAPFWGSKQGKWLRFYLKWHFVWSRAALAAERRSPRGSGVIDWRCLGVIPALHSRVGENWYQRPEMSSWVGNFGIGGSVPRKHRSPGNESDQFFGLERLSSRRLTGDGSRPHASNEMLNLTNPCGAWIRVQVPGCWFQTTPC